MLGKFEICFEIGAISYSGWNHNGFNKTTKSHQFHVWIFMVFHIWNSYYFIEQHGLYQFILCWWCWLLTRSTCGLWHSLVLGIWWSWYSCMWRPLTIQTNWKLMESCFVQEIRHVYNVQCSRVGDTIALYCRVTRMFNFVYRKAFGRVDITAGGDLTQLKPVG